MANDRHEQSNGHDDGECQREGQRIDSADQFAQVIALPHRLGQSGLFGEGLIALGLLAEIGHIGAVDVNGDGETAIIAVFAPLDCTSTLYETSFHVPKTRL